MNKKIIIIGLVVIVVAIVVLVGVFLGGKKDTKSETTKDTSGEEVVVDSVDYENAEVSTIKFKIKNSTGKEISKIYIRDNSEENFSNELTGSIKAGEEKQVEYGKYSPIFIWDFKISFKDDIEKTLNTQIAANVLYDGATIELTDNEDTVEAINHDMKPVEEAENEDETGSEENPEETITNENEVETPKDEEKEEKEEKEENKDGDEPEDEVQKRVNKEKETINEEKEDE